MKLGVLILIPSIPGKTYPTLLVPLFQLDNGFYQWNCPTTLSLQAVLTPSGGNIFNLIIVLVFLR
jgi:hypothetical protein